MSSAPVATDPTADETTMDSLLSSAVNLNGNHSPAGHARDAFRTLEDIRKQLLGDVVQKGLQTAQESGTKDDSDLALIGRRERKKRFVTSYTFALYWLTSANKIK